MRNLKNIFLGLTAMATLVSCNNLGNKKEINAAETAQQDSIHEHTHACTMHPEITGKE